MPAEAESAGTESAAAQLPAGPHDPAAALRAALPELALGEHAFRGETTLILPAADLPAAAAFLKSAAGLNYNYLSDISAVDYAPVAGEPGFAAFSELEQAAAERPARFAVSYHLLSMLHARRLRLKVYVEEGESIPTLTTLWPAANWLEREIMDMMGIDFAGHPDKRRLLMPEDWQGHPHRRDYPLGYETVQFSFNAEDVQRHKPLARRES